MCPDGELGQGHDVVPEALLPTDVATPHDRDDDRSHRGPDRPDVLRAWLIGLQLVFQRLRQRFRLFGQERGAGASGSGSGLPLRHVDLLVGDDEVSAAVSQPISTPQRRVVASGVDLQMTGHGVEPLATQVVGVHQVEHAGVGFLQQERQPGPLETPMAQVRQLRLSGNPQPCASATHRG